MQLNLKQHKKDLLFVPLGGTNDIGLNCNLYHYNGKWLMVDLGIGFANKVPGVDILVPDLSFIKERKKDLVGLVITHIHEDHLGAVGHLWEELKMPIYTSSFTATFLREKLSEKSFANQVEINIIGEEEVDLKPFKIDFIGLTHSTPEMKAALIKTDEGNILHTGDWKFDSNPVVGSVSEKHKLEKLGKEGSVLAMTCDSTNIFKEGRAGSEGDLYESLRNIVSKKKGMVCLTTFASNVGRIKTFMEVAKSCNRKVVLAGRSMLRIVDVGRKTGYLTDLPSIISAHDIKKHDRRDVIIFATGCQGEALASMNKIAKSVHPRIHMDSRDTVIFSSKMIPGNERDIIDLLNNLSEKEVEVITEDNAFVHVSGHQGRDELREMYELVKPKMAIPVHGETMHLSEHRKFLKKLGINHTIKVKDGSVIKISKTGLENIGTVPTGQLAINGKTIISLESDILKKRKKMMYSGLVAVTLMCNENYQIVADPVVLTPGAYEVKDEKDRDFIEALKDEIVFEADRVTKVMCDAKVKRGNKKKKRHHTPEQFDFAIKQAVRKAINKVFNDVIGNKPVVKVGIAII